MSKSDVTLTTTTGSGWINNGTVYTDVPTYISGDYVSRTNVADYGSIVNTPSVISDEELAKMVATMNVSYNKNGRKEIKHQRSAGRALQERLNEL